MSNFLFGAAYYDEYMPCDRIDEDFRLLKEGGFNTVRIAESTWSTLEPSDGVVDLTHIPGVPEVVHHLIGVVPHRRSALIEVSSP